MSEKMFEIGSTLVREEVEFNTGMTYSNSKGNSSICLRVNEEKIATRGQLSKSFWTGGKIVILTKERTYKGSRIHAQ